eukprot:1407070-Pleurochrysis_carterae.AAC.3
MTAVEGRAILRDAMARTMATRGATAGRMARTLGVSQARLFPEEQKRLTGKWLCLGLRGESD